MVRGLYTAGVGMMAVMNKFDVVADNIANVNTTGYKKDNVITQSFSDELMKRLNDPALNQVRHDVAVGRMRLGVFVDTIATDFSTGAMSVTGGEFDLAVAGDGFFTVSAPDKNGDMADMYTRDGTFTILNGILVTANGYAVQGQNGNITVPEGEFVVSQTGSVYVNGEYVDALRMVSFEDNSGASANGSQTLHKYKDNLYTATEYSEIVPFKGTVEQGILEMSNVNPVREMVDMITVNRLYESNQRVITTIDATLNRAVNDIARR
jgi:flagellar basal-body rod protein FlgG